eukprot:3927016-Pleurochrysis_carterae.AAC.2
MSAMKGFVMGVIASSALMVAVARRRRRGEPGSWLVATGGLFAEDTADRALLNRSTVAASSVRRLQFDANLGRIVDGFVRPGGVARFEIRVKAGRRVRISVEDPSELLRMRWCVGQPPNADEAQVIRLESKRDAKQLPKMDSKLDVKGDGGKSGGTVERLPLKLSWTCVDADTTLYVELYHVSQSVSLPTVRFKLRAHMSAVAGWAMADDESDDEMSLVLRESGSKGSRPRLLQSVTQHMIAQLRVIRRLRLAVAAKKGAAQPAHPPLSHRLLEARANAHDPR